MEDETSSNISNDNDEVRSLTGDGTSSGVRWLD